MFIFLMKKNIFIVEGKDLNEKNKERYNKAGMDYIKDIKKYENMGEECNDIGNINIFKQNEFEEKWDKLIKDEFLGIKFSDENYIDSKLYVD